MTVVHDEKEILQVLKEVDCTTVSTLDRSGIRTRMMHFWSDENLNVYLASIKGDPKILQISRNKMISLLVYQRAQDLNEAREVEIAGVAIIIRDEAERKRAFAELAKKSPVVSYFVETGDVGKLDLIKVVPHEIRFRIFKEIVQGVPPTVVRRSETIGQALQPTTATQGRSSKLRSWITEIRPSFLTASAVSILLGTVVAWAITGIFHWDFFLLALVGGVCIHAGANVSNDYFDHQSGTDDVNVEFVRPFSGGSRMIQLGLLSPREVLVGSFVFFGIGGAIGLYLAFTRGSVILVLGLIGVFSGLFYTAPPFRLASRGVGELFVGINFGVLLTLGAFYVQAQTFALDPLFVSVPVALLIAAVLYINEFPDYTADREVGKRTLVVRLGRRRAVKGYIAILATVPISIIIAVALGIMSSYTLIALSTLPFSVLGIRYARKVHDSSFDLVPAYASTVANHLLTGLILGLAYLLQALVVSPIYVAMVGLLLIGLAAFLSRWIQSQARTMEGLRISVK
ncbi:MAG: 1,4-dihydroxy-2-naphthoate octaprenyltransferase [Candidatus Thorarchaeota archaeon]